MNPITLLKGYLMSKHIHSLHAPLIFMVSMAFITHVAIANNKPNKTPGSDEGGGRYTNINSQRVPDNNNQINYNLSEKNYAPSSLTYSSSQSTANNGGGNLESFYLKLLSYNVLRNVQTQTSAGDSNFNVFLIYYHDKIYGDDRSAFWQMVQNNQIQTDADVQNFANQQISQYVSLYQNFLQIQQNYPSTVTNTVSQYAAHQLPPVAGCNPACDNIDFENASLSAWNAYYAVNTSSLTAFSNTAPVGGACGAVTRSALDPNTNTYQVTLTSGAGLDPVAGALIPVVCPTGGSHSCRIGDSTRNGAQMGILQQTFTVTNNNANFVYMYAVVLENPGHNYYQQPYFNVQMLDQNGNPIPNCGNYSVVSGPNLPGYTAIYYAPDGDTAYCKPWTTIFVPLQAYIGQCITVKVSVSDCALGGHFGYAYFDATCLSNIIPSNPVICGRNITLTAPAGVSSYQWMGPCIVGATNTQTITISCAGTYSVVLSSAINALCSDTLTINVPSATPPTVTIASSNITCNGDNNGVATANVANGLAPYTYSWSNGGTSATDNNLTVGTYTVTVNDANNCQAIDSVTITQPAALVANINSSSNISCNGGNTGSATVSVAGGTSPYNYSWSNGGTSAIDNNLSAGTYTVTITDGNNCIATASVTLTQPATAVSVNVNVTTNISCFGGNNASATASGNGGTAPYNYLWSNNNSSVVANNLSAGNYSVTVTDANGCTATSSIVITQPALLVGAASSGSNVSCFGGNNGSANASAIGGTSPYNYLWSNGATTAIANNLAAATYSVTITDANGCTSTTSVIISQPVQLNATGSASNNVSCNGGANGSVLATVNGGTPGYTYLWNTVPPQTSPTAFNVSAGTYNVTVTDANGCSATVNATVTQPAPIVITFGTQPPTCNALENGSAIALVNGGTPSYTYQWNTVPAQSSQTAFNIGAGSYTVTVTDSHGCTASNSVTITQPNALTTSIATSTNVSCYGLHNGNASVSANGGTGNYTYAWSTSPVQTSANATGLSAGSYTITVTDAHGCSNATTAVISQPARVITTVTGPDTICSGSNAVITATSNGGNGTYIYQWSNSNGTGNTITVSPSNTTTYTVSATDGNGCKGDTASLTVVPLKLTSAAVSISAAQTLCHGDSATIFVNVNTQNSGNVTITWNNYLVGVGPFRVAPSTTTTYSVTVTDGCGNTVTKSVTITVNPLPVISIPHQSGAACHDVVLNFSDTNRANAGSSYIWNFGDNQTSTQRSPSHQYDASGRYVVSVQVTSYAGCVNNAQNLVDINIYPTATAQFVANPNSAQVVNPTIAFVDNSTNATQWAWDFGDGATSRIQSPTHTYPQVVAGYKVHLYTTNTYGCADSTEDSVHIVPDYRIFIPNAFSPNGDDLNDYFTAKGIGIVTFTMLIFDRWGNELYATNNINKGWDGRVKGKTEIAQEDTYVYKIEVTDIFNEAHQYIGAVTLIK
jgi:gliding motility-associated-like protein